jgi:hypothetical protein
VYRLGFSGGFLVHSSDGTLGLVLASPSDETVYVAAAIRVDKHTHLEISGWAEVDGEHIVAVGDTHLEVTKLMPPLNAAVISIVPVRHPVTK